ncbi:MAG: hypothetical protein KIT14_07225 [bacterium]|nr:hypothetical protein [bacterium]
MRSRTTALLSPVLPAVLAGVLLLGAPLAGATTPSGGSSSTKQSSGMSRGHASGATKKKHSPKRHKRHAGKSSHKSSTPKNATSNQPS